MLEREWVEVGNQLAVDASPAQTLRGAHQGMATDTAKCSAGPAGRVAEEDADVRVVASYAQGLVLSVYHYRGDWRIEDWSAIEKWEVDEWLEQEGDPGNPMGGAAALQLQVKPPTSKSLILPQPQNLSFFGGQMFWSDAPGSPQQRHV